MSDSTESSARFYRIISLVVDVGTQTLLDTFYSKVRKEDVSIVFGTSKVKAEFFKLKGKNALTKVQYNKVTSANPDPDTYDISLLTTLLTNQKLCGIPPPAKGWGTTPPDSSDLSVGADLLRLRELRNEIVGRRTNAQLEVADYSMFWSKVEVILVRLAKDVSQAEEKKIKEMIRNTETGPIEPLHDREKKLLQVFLQWQKEDNEKYRTKMTEVLNSLNNLSLKVDNIKRTDETNAVRFDSGDTLSSLQSQVVRQIQSFGSIAKQDDVNQVDNIKTPRYEADAVRSDSEDTLSSLQSQVVSLVQSFGSIAKQDDVNQMQAYLKNMGDTVQTIVQTMTILQQQLAANNRNVEALTKKTHTDENAQAKPATVEHIQDISFSKRGNEQGDGFYYHPGSGPPVPHGGPGSFNVYGEDVRFEGTMAIHSSQSNQSYSETQSVQDSGTSSMGSLKSAWQPFKKEHDDTLSQTMVLALHEQMKSVGVLISGGNLGGTVFRVGSKYVMTALHVINNIIDPTKTGVWDVTLLESTDTHINFHESPLTPPMVPYRLKRDFMYNVDLDVALLEVTNPSNLPMKLNLCKDEIGVTNVSLIGYGHPGQIKKCLDPKCEIVHPNSHRILSAQAWLQQNKNFFKLALHGIGRNPALVDKGYQGYDQSSKLIFDCYMKRGASGAPALTNDNERSVQVVGILTHGLPDFYFSLPELMKPQFPKNYRLEVGAKMKDIFNWINSQSREIAKDLFGEGSQMPDRNQLQLPKEITDMDNETVETYIRALEKGKTEYNNIRVMVVGHFGVGKTTLVNRLFGQFKDEETTETPSTNGIETHVRQCNIISDDKNEKMIWKQKKDGNQINWGQVLLQKTQSIAEDDTCEEKIETTLVTESELQPHGTNEHAISTLENVERSDAAVVSQSSEEHKDIVPEEVQEPVLLPESEEELAKEQQKLNQQECVMRLVQNSPKDLEDNTNKINISVWDFAGQYAFYNTHQVFLSRRAIYLIVTNMSKDLTDEVNDTCFEDSTGGRKLKVLDFARFWLNSIHEFCQTGKEGEPPVLLVGTFADEYSKRQNIDETNYQLRKNDLEETYFDPLRTALGDGAAENHILKHFMIDNNCTVDKTSSQFEELKKEILKISKKQSYVGDLIPTKFLLLEEALNKKRKEGTKILNKEVDFSKCNEESRFKLDEKEVDVFLRFYHEVGSIIYFNENTLKDYILLEPKWLIDAFKGLITAEEFMRNTDQKKFIRWKKFAKTAILEKDLIDMCWKDMAISERTLLLEYMEKLGLIVKDRKKQDSYFAPCVLKQAPSESLLKLCDTKKGECPFSTDEKTFTSKLCYTTKSKFIPMAIFNRLLADCITRWEIHRKKNHESGEERVDIYCGCGIFSLQNAHILYVHFRDNVVQIWIVRCSKKSPSKEICVEVKKHMDDFFEKVFKKCEVERHFKCPTGPSQKDAMYPHDKLKKDSSVYCDYHEHELPSPDLTGCWFSDDRNDGHLNAKTGHADRHQNVELNWYLRLKSSEYYFIKLVDKSKWKSLGMAGKQLCLFGETMIQYLCRHSNDAIQGNTILKEADIWQCEKGSLLLHDRKNDICMYILSEAAAKPRSGNFLKLWCGRLFYCFCPP